MSSNKHQAMKAELKPYQLGRRLGSGVKAIISTELNSWTVTIDGADDGAIYHNDIGYFNSAWYRTRLSQYDVKLVLRPKEHLTLPITHNGETFVPYERMESLFDIEDFSSELEYLVRREDDGNVFISIQKQLSIIEKLIEWNFHIDEPQGTWISVDELDNNPYEN